MVEKADMADGLLLELEEERGRWLFVIIVNIMFVIIIIVVIVIIVIVAIVIMTARKEAIVLYHFCHYSQNHPHLCAYKVRPFERVPRD